MQTPKAEPEALQAFKELEKLPHRDELRFSLGPGKPTIHLRDDNVLSLSAGDVEVVLDGNSGTLVLRATTVFVEAGDIEFSTESEGRGVIWNGAALNSALRPNAISGEISVLLPKGEYYPPLARKALRKIMPEVLVLLPGAEVPVPADFYKTFTDEQPIYTETEELKNMFQLFGILGKIGE